MSIEKKGELMDNLGRELKERRKLRELTLTELSNISGVHTSYLARIERGERFPSGRILKKLAEPLGFTEIELFKLAGFLSRDDSDARIEKLKAELKREIALSYGDLCNKINSL